MYISTIFRLLKQSFDCFNIKGYAFACLWQSAAFIKQSLHFTYDLAIRKHVAKIKQIR